MEKITVKQCAFSDMEGAPGFADLLAEYAEESAIAGMPRPAIQSAMYQTLEATGSMFVFVAYKGDKLVGFLVMLSHVLPHYSVRMAVSESFFVASAHRKHGAGLKLLHAAERHAKELGAKGLMVSAPTGGRLADVLPALGYRETNRVFFLGLQP